MSYTIPLFNLNFDEKEEEQVLEVLRSKWISTGPKCEELEGKFKEMLGAKHALTVANCTAALHLALLAAGIKAGDEVIVPSLTFVATVNAVRYVGATPVFCDVCGSEDLTIDPIRTEELITDRTTAIIVMHYGGFPCQMSSILQIAQKHKLKLIEDACHGPLSEYNGQKLGTIGDVGCFSFFSNKNISTGEGGMLVTNDEALYEKAKLLRSHGMTSMSYDRASGHNTTYDVVDLGYNYRMDDIRAGIGMAQLEKLLPDIEKRATIRAKYIELLKKEKRITIPFANHMEMSASYIFPLVLNEATAEIRDRMRAYLAEQGIQTSVHYPAAHRFRIYRKYAKDNLNKTEYATDCEMTLPMYGALTEEQVSFIAEQVLAGLNLVYG